MSNYRWITFPIPSNRRYLLADSDFDILTFPEIHYRDELLDAKFKEHGLRANLEFDTHYDESTICIVRPLTWKYAYVTAPLYEQKEDGKYVKISDSFTGKTTAPTLYDWVKSEIEICYQEVKEEQTERFLNLFNKNSLDGGKTSWMHITPYRYTDDISFKEKYIPEGFIKVCEKYNIYNYDLKDIFFIKKMDAHGKAVDIIVPNEFKGLVIGKNGQNIKCIAHLINAKRINVI